MKVIPHNSKTDLRMCVPTQGYSDAEYDYRAARREEQRWLEKEWLAETPVPMTWKVNHSKSRKRGLSR